MIFKRLIAITFLITIIGTITFLIFWDLPAPTKQIERKIDINRFKKYD